MKKLIIIPQRVFEVLKSRDVVLSKLGDINYMLTELSVADIAEIVIATNDFAFEGDLDFVSIIDMEELLRTANLPDALRETWERRYMTRYESAILRYKTEVDTFVPCYTLNSVDETLWVAVQQKQHLGDSDPKGLLIKSNSDFFNSLIEQALHVKSFEEMCKSNLFHFYLQSL